jgi:hypothetical protein
MEITRELIEDLLPLYLADEVSPETRSIMETYLENDVKLAKMVEQSKLAMEAVEIPSVAEIDDEMKLFRKAQRQMLQEHRLTQYYIFMGLSIFFTLSWLTVIAFDIARLGLPTFIVAAGCWIAMGNFSLQMNESQKEWFSE